MKAFNGGRAKPIVPKPFPSQTFLRIKMSGPNLSQDAPLPASHFHVKSTVDSLRSENPEGIMFVLSILLSL
jgi:hypothetical protein